MLSTPVGWVFIDTLVTLLIGCVLGIVSVKLTALFPTRTAAPDTRERAHA